MAKRKNFGPLTYDRVLNVTDHFPEPPRWRADCIDLLRQAGYYDRIRGRAYSHIPDRQLFAVARDVLHRARDYLQWYSRTALAKQAAIDNLAALYIAFELDPEIAAVDPSELERELFK